VHGFLGEFRREAERNAELLRDLAATGVSLIGIDPSITLTYRAEYRDAGIDVPAVLLLQEWLAGRRGDVPQAEEQASFRLLAHCTERTNAAASLRDWQNAFARYGLNLEIPAAGCCGMAGTYGHEVEHRAMSAHLYELSWAKHLAGDDKEALATGYSCRSQVKRLRGVVLRHPAQALLSALTRCRQ
jgi:Fe-S oxidoreductase